MLTRDIYGMPALRTFAASKFLAAVYLRLTAFTTPSVRLSIKSTHPRTSVSRSSAKTSACSYLKKIRVFLSLHGLLLDWADVADAIQNSVDLELAKYVEKLWNQKNYARIRFRSTAGASVASTSMIQYVAFTNGKRPRR